VSVLVRFARFWWDFVVGDEWRIALSVALATVLGALAAHDHRIDGQVIACGVGAVVMTASCGILIVGGRRSRR
jgi:hypothetical protein